ncbi:hypothetical protein [Atlantibacter hermannii]|uniref:hypothetical protein n=1 Tax=Atlantibacter hermannii TaxID=565 RepID=UPI0022B791EF|nr:hypothetical protein [Atlantibacter hermannii]MCZ7837044.1 hypothetical protein [Atlantibacter hermannii]
MRRKIMFFICFLLFWTLTAKAGERGYYFFVWGNESGKTYVKKYRAEDKIYANNESCWKERKGDSIAAVYIITYPQGMTDLLIKSFLSGNVSVIANIRESLRNFSDDQVSPSHGFDGMIIVNKKGYDVEIDTIPVQGGRYLYKRNFVIDSNDYSLFDKQLCEALAPIDNYFSP